MSKTPPQACKPSKREPLLALPITRIHFMDTMPKVLCDLSFTVGIIGAAHMIQITALVAVDAGEVNPLKQSPHDTANK
jgi:hypothetical protein